MTTNIDQNDCIKYKTYIKSFISKLIVFSILTILLFLMFKQQDNNLKEIQDAFINNKELICSSTGSNKIVSKAKGYRFEKNNPKLISDGTDLFNINSCKRR